MASPYDSEEKDVQQFSGAAGTIKVEDFKEFTMWCELQNSRNPNFNPKYMVEKTFGCLEEEPLSNYAKFEATHLTEIIVWRDFYALTYVWWSS